MVYYNVVATCNPLDLLFYKFSLRKGVNKQVKDTKLKFDDYEQCIKSMQVKEVTMNCIRSDHHKLFTYEIKKVGLSAYDDKRYICDDGVTTRAHGHFANVD